MSVRIGLAFVVAWSLGVPAQHAFGTLIGAAIHLEASNSNGSGSADFLLPSAPSDPFDWSLSTPVVVHSHAHPAKVLGSINSLHVSYLDDPKAVLDFSVTAGNTPTVFLIRSSIVTFTPIADAEGFAEAAITVEDERSNGVLLIGLLSGFKAYEARYGAGHNPSTPFANLAPPLGTLDDSISEALRKPGGSGTIPISGQVGSIQSEFHFLLSAHDSAAGSSAFQVTGPTNVSEPSTLMLLAAGLAGLALMRARSFR